MPMIRRHWRRIESPHGEGTVHDGDQHIATVRYGLRVLQEVVGRQHWSGSTATQGERRIIGHLQVLSSALPFNENQLTLRLSDGRSLSFVAAASGSCYTITSASALT